MVYWLDRDVRIDITRKLFGSNSLAGFVDSTQNEALANVIIDQCRQVHGAFLELNSTKDIGEGHKPNIAWGLQMRTQGEVI